MHVNNMCRMRTAQLLTLTVVTGRSTGVAKAGVLDGSLGEFRLIIITCASPSVLMSTY